MFADIEHFKSAIAIENILMPYKKGRLAPDKKTRLPKEPITPEICMEVLKSTNYARNIKDMLQCIADLPQSEQAHFKEVVLATFDRREQPNDVLVWGKKLAVANGYEAELSAILSELKDKVFLRSIVDKGFASLKNTVADEDFSAYGKVTFLSQDGVEFDKNVKYPKYVDLSCCDKVVFRDADLRDCAGVKFKKGSYVQIFGEAKLPLKTNLLESAEVVGDLNQAEGLDCSVYDVLKMEGDYYSGNELDFSSVVCPSFKDGAKISLSSVQGFVESTDFSMCKEITLDACNLYGVNKVTLQNCDKLTLKKSSNLPQIEGIEKCSEVVVKNCTIYDQSRWHFKKGAKVTLQTRDGLPLDIDFSQCAEVNLEWTPLGSFEELKFPEVDRVVLDRVRKFPKKLDVSQCREVSAEGAEFLYLSELRFGEGAKVSLKNASYLPEVVDFSKCQEVNLEGTEFDRVKQLVFKNRQQMENSSCSLPKTWAGKLVFAEEEPQNDLGLAMVAAKTKGGR